MDTFHQVKYWLDCADYDIQTAQAMLQTKRFLYVGFMCHQSIEKALKAIFVARKPETELPYIHNLVKLANLAEIASEMPKAYLSLLDVLNPLNIEARYPTNRNLLLKSLSEARCEKMITETEVLLEWLKTKC